MNNRNLGLVAGLSALALGQSSSPYALGSRQIQKHKPILRRAYGSNAAKAATKRGYQSNRNPKARKSHAN